MKTTHSKKNPSRILITIILASLLAAGCSVGPNYHRSTVTTPPEFKELAGWKVAEPSDTLFRAGWWRVYGDSLLDTLESEVAISNQSVAAACAQYREAIAQVKSARASYFPTVSAQGSYTRDKSSQNARTGSTTSVVPEYLLEGSASWEPDIWGKVRRTVESNRASAQASAADLAALCLSTQATLAQDYFALRVADAQKRLLDSTVFIYRKFLDLTEQRHEQGIASQSDVAVAQTQLSSAQAQLLDAGVARSQYEHAVATLIGQPASLFSIEPETLPIRIVVTPPSVPSTLLERRPDIAAAERAVAAENAQIGVAKAAYYPSITLSATGGYESQTLTNPSWLIPSASQLWSWTGGFAEQLFTGGSRSAAVEQAKAAYEAQVATYRQTVLAAFQNVEDNLATLRILEQEAASQDSAVSAAARSTAVEIDQYKQGTVSALNVITTQTIELINKETAVTLLGKRIAASVQLIEAIGGGWSTDSLKKL